MALPVDSESMPVPLPVVTKQPWTSDNIKPVTDFLDAVDALAQTQRAKHARVRVHVDRSLPTRNSSGLCAAMDFSAADVVSEDECARIDWSVYRPWALNFMSHATRQLTECTDDAFIDAIEECMDRASRLVAAESHRGGTTSFG